ACGRCNNTVVEPLDDFMATRFPPTSLARAELDLRSYSKVPPTTVLVGFDEEIGSFDVVLTARHGATVKSSIKKRNNSFYIVASSEEEGLRLAAKWMTKDREALHITAQGAVRCRHLRFKHDVDWQVASRAVAKMFYCYLLLELGEKVIESVPARILRD